MKRQFYSSQCTSLYEIIWLLKFLMYWQNNKSALKKKPFLSIQTSWINCNISHQQMSHTVAEMHTEHSSGVKLVTWPICSTWLSAINQWLLKCMYHRHGNYRAPPWVTSQPPSIYPGSVTTAFKVMRCHFFQIICKPTLCVSALKWLCFEVFCLQVLTFSCCITPTSAHTPAGDCKQKKVQPALV